MPYKDPEQRRAYMREWYARPENRERTIAKVAKRKHTDYAGVCRNCGGPTVGISKDQAPEWCSKPECLAAQRKARGPGYWTAFHQRRSEGQKEKNRRDDSLEVPN